MKPTFIGGAGYTPICRITEIRGSGPSDLRYTAVPAFPSPLNSIGSAMLSREQFWILERFAERFGATYGEGDIVQHNGNGSNGSVTAAGIYCLVKGALLEGDRVAGYLVQRLNLNLPFLFAPEDTLKMVQRAPEPKSEAPTIISLEFPDVENFINGIVPSSKTIKTSLCDITERLQLHGRYSLGLDDSILTFTVARLEPIVTITYNPEEVKTAILQRGPKAEFTITRKAKDA